MSLPENPIAGYDSYSYHHVLVACDTTLTAEEIATSPKASIYIRDRKQGTYDLIKSPSGRGNYIIVIDSMTDAEFILDDITWMTNTGADSVIKGQYVSIASTGSFTVQEPRGIRFFNIIHDVATSLESNANGIVWLMKTIFVGHVFDKSVEDYITTIRPQFFQISGMEAEFDLEGGRYTIKTADISNGVAKFPQTSNIVQGISIDTDTEGNTLVGVMQLLEDRINKRYNALYDKTAKTLERQGKKIDDTFRRISYDIILDTEFDERYLVDDFQEQEKTGNGKAGGIITFDQDTTIERAMMSILNKCSQIQLAGKDGFDGKRFTYKIVSTLHTSDTEYVIIFRVRQFEVFTNSTIADVYAGGGDKLIADRLIEFNYFFTGKNTDIIDFNIKMAMAHSFYAQITSTSNITKDPCDTATTTTSANSVDEQSKVVRGKTPLFPDILLKDVDIRNSLDSDRVIRFRQLMKRQVALESVGIQIQIIGNPNLLGAFVVLPSDYTDNPTASVRTDTQSFMKDWSKFPCLSKINIRMPSSEENPYGDFGEDFWYTGYYFLYKIEHSFSGGLFTQKLTMNALTFEHDLDNQPPGEAVSVEGDSSGSSGFAETSPAGNAVSKCSKPSTGNA